MATPGVTECCDSGLRVQFPHPCCRRFNSDMICLGAAPAGDAFSPNPGNKSPQGPFQTCPATSAPYTTANPYYVCDSKGECGEPQIPVTEYATGGTPRHPQHLTTLISRVEMPAGVWYMCSRPRLTMEDVQTPAV